jgi:cardiolipin synthase
MVGRKRIEFPYLPGNTIRWLKSGTGYFDELERLLDSAKHEIHLQTYIFTSDATGERIANALMRAAQRNVKVFLFVDAYGSQDMTSAMIKAFAASGVTFRKYGQLYSRGRFHIGRRMHHKITVVDGLYSIVGGINISNHYNDTPQEKAWLDYAVCMEGVVSRKLQLICRQRWLNVRFRRMSRKEYARILPGDNHSPKGTTRIRVRRNDFIRNKHECAISYRQAIRKSKKSLLIVGGYFLPGGRTRRLMRHALRRGVEISIIVPEKSDVGVMILARKYLYNWISRNGIRLFEYKPSNVHGKVLIADGVWTSIGSYDLNNLSTYSNIELNVDIADENFSAGFSAHLEQVMTEECVEVVGDIAYRESTWVYRFLMWMAYRLVKTLFVLSVILAGKREKEF